MTNEYEVERLRRLAELETGPHSDPLFKQKYGPGSFGSHEALHTSNLILHLIERELAEHPAILLHPEWFAHVRAAQDELSSLYQKIGASQS